LILLVGAVAASAYGAIHNQISYSFSNEYFTQFKFIQFGLPWAQDYPRLGAALVGALATWWMGVLVCIILGLFGFMFPSPKQMGLNLTKSLVVVTGVALLTGLLGLIYGYIKIDNETVINYMHWVRPGVTDPVQFVRVGFMHNASYLGGLTGLIAGIIYLFVVKSSYNKSEDFNSCLVNSDKRYVS
jgi:hypothetical protein